MTEMKCDNCGQIFISLKNAPLTKTPRCPSCRIIWRREYQRKLMRQRGGITNFRKNIKVLDLDKLYRMPKYSSFEEARKKDLELRREYQTRPRLELIKLLDSRCKKCGFNDIRALQIDFINGGHMRIKKERFKNDSTAMWRFYLNNIENRKEIQLLCANCNWIKRYENGETKPRTLL